MDLVSPIVKDLVLIGGGHSHAIALRLFGMKPLPGVRLTLISEHSDTPYSGMLPGYVAGFYRYDECHIDLRALCQFAGAQFYPAQVVGLDLPNNRVICRDRPPVRFDLLSIDIGSTPKLPAVMGDASAIIPAKPVRQFLLNWDHLVETITNHPQKPVSIGIVGGGAGGVELALTMQSRIQTILQQAGASLDHLTMHLVHRDANLLTHHNPWIQRHFRQLLTRRGIELHLGEEVREVQPHRFRCKSGLTIACDAIFWVTQAAAPEWLWQTGLKLDRDGFVLVDDGLRSLSHAQVFAAGDVATMVNYARPKAGVFAVRQGKPLVQNLCRALQNQPPKPFRPQKQYLSLIGTGTGEAVASRGVWGWQSPLLWRWKDQIDRAFMRRFNDLPQMQPFSKPIDSAFFHLQTPNPEPSPLPCAGCGAKVGSSTLERVLHRIQPTPDSQSNVLIGLHTPDDAAVIKVPADQVLVQTVDYLPTLVNDPFTFGQISTHHALSDILAMGAIPHSALAIATLPYAQPANLEETLYQLLSGAMQVLQEANVELIGGHTTTAPTLAFGLTCNGFADPNQLLRKGGLQPGQVLILTKALGTGVLFAAQMQQKVKASWIDDAIASMLQSNQPALSCLLDASATACTDITGFGLVGHLLEMIRASTNVAVNLELDAVPLLQGAQGLAAQGITSSLYSENARALQFVTDSTRSELPRSLLVDPQTSGGLLAAIPQAMGDRCLTALQQAGYHHSAIIGHVHPLDGMTQPMILS